ncbi:MAG: hypothetical protein P8H62_06605 [Henriciella sp.]|nr:hypothetical protein [Henriciella sp.]
MNRQQAASLPASIANSQVMLNAKPDEIDTFLTSDPTPKKVSRRQWRRARVRRGKT